MTATAHPCLPVCRSGLALATKVTLDQVLGFALWHAALAAIHHPHREALQQLWEDRVAGRQQPVLLKQA